MIVGAGLAGLIAAHVFQKEQIVESAPAPAQLHKALLRFRTEAVSKLTGIDFKPVLVRKGIWYHGKFCKPNILVANQYSLKCLGGLQSRSIWDLESVTRYVAPETFYEQLVESVDKRVQWGVEADFNAGPEFEPLISTAPMDAVLKQLGIKHDIDFLRAPIHVVRYKIENCNLHQTIYYPDPEYSMYRASITGDILIVEFAKAPSGEWYNDLVNSFGLRSGIPTSHDSVKQKYGKISPIHDGVRKHIISKLTLDHNIFSLGRFATWRNILLDDVVNDSAVIKKLMTASEYERKLIGSK